jgi:hypothetical protein
MKARWIGFGAKMAVMVAAFVAVVGLVTMLLWNSLVPALFHGPEITYLQALGLLVLSRILVGGFGKHRGAMRHHRWKSRVHEHLDKLTPEEREKMRSEWREYCGWNEEAPPEK